MSNNRLISAMIGAKVSYDALPYQIGDENIDRLEFDGLYTLDEIAAKDFVDYWYNV